MDISAILSFAGLHVPVTSQQSKLCVTIRRQPATICIQPATIRRQPGNIPSLQLREPIPGQQREPRQVLQVHTRGWWSSLNQRPRCLVWRDTSIYHQTDTKFGWVDKKGRSKDHSTKSKNFVKQKP